MDDPVRIAMDHKAIISNNQFESFHENCIVLLSISQCTFSGNYASNNRFGPSVSLLYGVDVVANGNMTREAIGEFGLQNKLIDNNLQLS